MKVLLINLVLAGIWVATTQQFTAANLVVGFLLGHLGMSVVAYLMPGSSLGAGLRRCRSAVRLALFFGWELLLSNFRVARDVLRIRCVHKPAILAFRMKARTDWEITLLTILIILTPGTLVVDVDEEAYVLYVHVLDGPSPEAFQKEIAEGFEARILEVTR